MKESSWRIGKGKKAWVVRLVVFDGLETYGNAWIQAVEVVGAANHKDAVVALEAVYFVEEVASDVVGDDGVEVFKDEVAGGEFSCLGKDESNAPLRPHELRSCVSRT
jgi:hypothetical protein